MSEDEFSKTSRLRFGCADAPEYPKDAASRISRELPPVDLYAVPAGCCAGDSDPGRVRPQNEDSYLICTRPDGRFTFAAVADGVGGRMAGEVASRLCLTTLFEEWDRLNREGHFDSMTPDAIPVFLSETVRKANGAVFSSAASQPLENRMCTTVAALFLARKKAFTVHLGDSRIYRVRNGEIMQLTHDHSLVAELLDAGTIAPDEVRNHPLAHIISRSVGVYETVEPEICVFEHVPGDRWLLCSDGLSDVAEAEEIRDAVWNSSDPADAVHGLLKLVLKRGGPDNITAICLFG